MASCLHTAICFCEAGEERRRSFGGEIQTQNCDVYSINEGIIQI